jgi:drug/metabolite transporter (DMT)-like permease
LLAAAIWGGGFVAQSTAMKAIGPFWFIGLRFAIAALATLPFTLLEARKAKIATSRRHLGLYLLIGLALFGGASTQQLGLQTTTVTNSSFITGLYVIFVPLIAVFFLRRSPHWIIWPGAIMAVSGIYMLSGGQLSALTIGDLLTVVCAVFWSVQITLAGTTVGETGRPLALSTAQSAGSSLPPLSNRSAWRISARRHPKSFMSASSPRASPSCCRSSPSATPPRRRRRSSSPPKRCSAQHSPRFFWERACRLSAMPVARLCLSLCL